MTGILLRDQGQGEPLLMVTEQVTSLSAQDVTDLVLELQQWLVVQATGVPFAVEEGGVDLAIGRPKCGGVLDDEIELVLTDGPG